jgi:hypothetical protein
MKRDRDGERSGRSCGHRHKGKSPIEVTLTGAAVAVAFSVYWYFNQNDMWPIFAILFGGVFPAVRGLRGMIAERSAAPKAKKIGPRERNAENERTVLRIAQGRAGRVTAAMVVLDSDLGLEDAEAVLESLTTKGHATMRVRDDGRIDYEFAEFLPN